MCEVSPENLALLKLFGSAMLVAGAFSLLTGKTYFRRVIDKRDEPFTFWSNTSGLAVLGILFWIGILFC